MKSELKSKEFLKELEKTTNHENPYLSKRN